MHFHAFILPARRQAFSSTADNARITMPATAVSMPASFNAGQPMPQQRQVEDADQDGVRSGDGRGRAGLAQGDRLLDAQHAQGQEDPGQQRQPGEPGACQDRKARIGEPIARQRPAFRSRRRQPEDDRRVTRVAAPLPGQLQKKIGAPEKSMATTASTRVDMVGAAAAAQADQRRCRRR